MQNSRRDRGQISGRRSRSAAAPPVGARNWLPPTETQSVICLRPLQRCLLTSPARRRYWPVALRVFDVAVVCGRLRWRTRAKTNWRWRRGRASQTVHRAETADETGLLQRGPGSEEEVGSSSGSSGGGGGGTLVHYLRAHLHLEGTTSILSCLEPLPLAACLLARFRPPYYIHAVWPPVGLVARHSAVRPVRARASLALGPRSIQRLCENGCLNHLYRSAWVALSFVETSDDERLLCPSSRPVRAGPAEAG
ncbi:hypothetical protein EJ04DRAFT_46525 [Polyplosphaeria fusca]|uniref:Uncharacterized protein n=1 Tax=Polyplosphaeria fusca TaxID=682080 RepID=A0A9P4QT32_9PLEO|nr:hypothetical protein EJ04DRAFT_46525 [Polyplosphaeria fusca]